MTIDRPQPTLTGLRLVLGVTGSIAAYKAVSLLRALVREGATVDVAMTRAASKFVAPLTFEVLSGRPVATGLFQAHGEMKHLSLPEQADAIVVAPATANFLAKAALGLADDLLSTMLLTARCPLICAPAMDGGMWGHPTVTAHVQALRARGVVVIDPEEGPLASGRLGQGRFAEEERIVSIVRTALRPKRDYEGQRLLLSAGPTQEAIDPVRYISNRSSGKMGYAIAEAAHQRGAQVVLVSGPTSLPPPAGVEMVAVETAEEMAKQMTTRLSWSTVVVMAAAVADFRPKQAATRKLKKHDRPTDTLHLEPTVDILTGLSSRRTTQVLVGFAAETDDLLTHAKSKLASKGLDVIVANDVTRQGAGFGSDRNAVTVLERDGRTTEFPLKGKRELADDILNVTRRWLATAIRPAAALHSVKKP
ncbi:MAG TPA: bifunctional phosphopantothenoylcysteine decarboxylase/phosphopantothenate--cysteine ligase CoaBC [Nitrospira sp.]|nr:bifunctional phosphopantothenoylcysteine decarboxylase/phosphopantothenate--cysteine ligase CoaBC [Nitrospira sp.]